MIDIPEPPKVILQSVERLRTAHAASPSHAGQIATDFLSELTSEVASFSEAEHPFAEFEGFTRELAHAPELVARLFESAGGSASAAEGAAGVISRSVADVLAQLHRGIAAARAESDLDDSELATLRYIKETSAAALRRAELARRSVPTNQATEHNKLGSEHVAGGLALIIVSILTISWCAGGGYERMRENANKEKGPWSSPGPERLIRRGLCEGRSQAECREEPRCLWHNNWNNHSFCVSGPDAPLGQ